jgi:hypothetical protein
MLKKKICANFQRIIELFTQKNYHQVLKNMGLGSGIRDPGYEVRDPKKPIPDPGPGVKKAPDPGSATLQIAKNYN